MITVEPQIAANALYEVLPLEIAPERALIISYIMNATARFDHIFSDYFPICEAACMDCSLCYERKAMLSSMLAKPDTRAWEVWKADASGSVPVGIIYLTEVVPGEDARAHYVFFDSSLTDKSGILNEMISWVLADHEDWHGLQRLTLTIPEHYFALARHAAKKLGFGGPFTYVRKNTRLPVEGIKRRSFLKDGKYWDQLILGRLREEGI